MRESIASPTSLSASVATSKREMCLVRGKTDSVIMSTSGNALAFLEFRESLLGGDDRGELTQVCLQLRAAKTHYGTGSMTLKGGCG